jgi:hypothetical protein
VAEGDFRFDGLVPLGIQSDGARGLKSAG